MDAQTIRQTLEHHKLALFQKYPLRSMALFGSYATGSANENSDVDILVDFLQPVGFEVVDLAIELETLLQKKVDLTTVKALKPALWEFVEPQLQYV